MDEVDGNCCGSNQQDGKKESGLGNSRLFHKNNNSKINEKTRIGRDDTHYNFGHKNRGLAIIFNHEVFEIPSYPLKPRAGTNVDCKCLVKHLKKLGFVVQVYHNLEYLDLKARIADAAQYDHTESDCFVMVILSHGDLGYLYAKNKKYEAEKIWLPFAAEVCPTLAGKPKIFFIQACQGSKLLSGITLQRTETDGKPYNSYKILAEVDFLIAYSTIPDYLSWRNTTEGSWFIQSLCQELEENAYNEDLLTILTFVARRVALDYESYTPEDPETHRKKQIPCITSILTRLVQFNLKDRSDLENAVDVDVEEDLNMKEESKSEK